MVRYALFVSAFALLVSPYAASAAEFDVGKRGVSIVKVNGEVILNESGRQMKGAGVVGSRLNSGASLNIGPSSEVWLKFEKESGKSSFLRLSTNSCGSVCGYNASTGVVSTAAYNSGGPCGEAQSYHDKARNIVGLPKHNFSKVETTSLVTFSGDESLRAGQEDRAPQTAAAQASTAGTGGAAYTARFQMPPAVIAPSFPGGGEVADYSQEITKKKKIDGARGIVSESALVSKKDLFSESSEIQKSVIGKQAESTKDSTKHTPLSKAAFVKPENAAQTLNLNTSSIQQVVGQSTATQSYVPGSESSPGAASTKSTKSTSKGSSSKKGGK